MKTTSFLHFEAAFEVFHYLSLLRPRYPFDRSLTSHIESQKWKDRDQLTGLFKTSVMISHSLVRSWFFGSYAYLTFEH